MRKDNELIKKNTFYLANNDKFCFILHHIKIIMYQYIMSLCIMLCYHHEFHITYYYVCKGDFFFKITWTKRYHIFESMVIIM